MVAGKIPDGWLDCPPNGLYLIEGKFMPLKTPLAQKFNNKLPVEARYPPDEIFRRASRNNVKIGLWIDLTNTNRYYSKSEIEREDCHYVKLNCKGHGIPPPQEVVQDFIKIVHTFILQHPRKCVAVHCTHGFNRTGFLIVAFMVEKLNFNVEHAIQKFASARPPGIYRPTYIKELFQRYGNISNLPPPPHQPHWAVKRNKFKKR